jgi:hypothetical protein
MAVELGIPPIPEFDEHPDDALMQDSMIEAPRLSYLEQRELDETEERRINSIVTYEADLATKAVDEQKTYDDYVSLGAAALESAINEEESHGLNAAVGKYMEAAAQFSGAIFEWRPKAGEHEIADPIILLQYGRSLAKQVESGRVTPYPNSKLSHPDTSKHNRREDLARIASETLQLAWDGIMNAPVPDEVKAETAIVAADGMRIAHDIPQAEAVVEQVDRLRGPLEDTDSQVVEIFMQSPDRRLFLARELANKAMLNLATDSHEVLVAA